MTAPDSSSWPAVVIAGSQARRMRASSNGHDYRVDVWVPPGPAPAAGFPVLYALDGSAIFASLVEAVSRTARRPDATGVAPGIIVAISHVADELYPTALRHQDFTEGPAAPDTGLDPAGPSGGAAAFLDFITAELRERLASDLPVDRTRQSLFGHSLAGYLVLHALLSRPHSFRNFLAISPSIWWNPAGLRQQLEQLPPQDCNVLIGVGEWEGELPPWQRKQADHQQTALRRAQRQMVAGARDFAQALRGVLGDSRVAFYEFADEDHASVLPVAISRSLRVAFRPE